MDFFTKSAIFEITGIIIKNYKLMKESYLTPEAEVLYLRLCSPLLQASGEDLYDPNRIDDPFV